MSENSIVAMACSYCFGKFYYEVYDPTIATNLIIRCDCQEKEGNPSQMAVLDVPTQKAIANVEFERALRRMTTPTGFLSRYIRIGLYFRRLLAALLGRGY